MKAQLRALLVGVVATAVVALGLPWNAQVAYAVGDVPVLTDVWLEVPPSTDRVTAVNEAQSFLVKGMFTDADTTNTHEALIRIGSGFVETTSGLAFGTRVFSISKVYPDDTPTLTPQDQFDLTVKIRDSDGNVSATWPMTVTVRNVAPAITAFTALPATISSGDTVTATGAFADPGTRDTWTATVSWGDGSADHTQTYVNGDPKTVTASHQYLVASTYVVTLTVTDDDTGTATETRNVLPINTPPSSVSPSAAPVVEDDTATLVVNFADPDLLDTHTVTVTWGDTSPDEEFELGAGVLTLSVTHVYRDPDTYLIEVTVTDAAGASADGSTLITVLVRNHAPVNLVLVAPPIAEGQTATLAGAFSDPDTADTHQLAVNWGDETSETFTLEAGDTTFSVTHAYPTPGTYTLSVTVTDPHDASTSGSVELTVLAKTAAELLDDLAALVRSWDLDDGTENSLMSKIDGARDNLDDNNTDGACSSLNALGNHVSAQTGKKLTLAQVEAFWALFNQILPRVPCTSVAAAEKASRLH